MEVAECVGSPSLAGVMRLLAQDHAGWAGALRAVSLSDMHMVCASWAACLSLARA